MFTCFSPESTLEECAHALREELVNGIMDSHADRNEVSARVPGVETIVFVETVPPRRRWVSPEDMRQSLKSAGLCPSSALLAEIPPITPPQADASGASIGPRLESENTEVRNEEDELDDDEFDDDDDEEEDDSDDDNMPGKSDAVAGKGMNSVGSGFLASGRLASHSKGRPGRSSGVPGSDRPQGHQFPEGGQVLGTGEVSSATGGLAIAYGIDAPRAAEIAEQQRAARLAALERRGVVSPVEPTLPSPGQERAVKGHMGDGRTRDDRARERQAILQRLQEDRESYLERRQPNLICPTTSAGERGGHEGE